MEPVISGCCSRLQQAWANQSRTTKIFVVALAALAISGALYLAHSMPLSQNAKIITLLGCAVSSLFLAVVAVNINKPKQHTLEEFSVFIKRFLDEGDPCTDLMNTPVFKDWGNLRVQLNRYWDSLPEEPRKNICEAVYGPNSQLNDFDDVLASPLLKEQADLPAFYRAWKGVSAAQNAMRASRFANLFMSSAPVV